MIRKLLLPIALAIAMPVQAHADGGGRPRAGGNCNCHGSASASVTTTVSGPASIAMGATETYTAVLTGTLQNGAGINVALAGLGGTIGDVEANTRIDTSQIVHENAYAGLPNGNIGDWSYDFTVTAPMSMGVILINALMLAFNGNADETGDLWDAFQYSVTVVPEPSTILLFGAGMAGLAALGRRQPSRSKKS